MANINKFKTILFSVVIFLLAGALTFSGFTIYQKNQEISDMVEKIVANETVIAELEAKQSVLEQNVTYNEQEKAQITAELEAIKSEKSNLEKENKNLKTQIANLKAQREAEAKAAMLAAKQPQPEAAPAVTPAPTNTGKVCYLTFDDGPSDNTLRILDTLKQYNIKATFFVINTNKVEYLRRISAEGHSIGLHSASHNYQAIYSNADAYFNDLSTIANIVETYTGKRSDIIRFPGGSSNVISKKYCNGIMSYLAAATANYGYTYFDWNVSSEDASAPLVSYTRIVDAVLNGARNKTNICVLMHDASGKTTTADALPFIIEGLIEQGFCFEPLTSSSPPFKHGINN